MLERTAASIEPCGLHRVLPSAATAAARASLVKGRDRRPPLQTTFWNHGASDIELLDACQALVRAPFHSPNPSPPSAAPAKPERRLDPMTASSFLLDFLYPTGAAALLRRLLLSSPERFDPTQKLSRHGARQYTTPASGGADQPHKTALAASQEALRVFLAPKMNKKQQEEQQEVEAEAEAGAGAQSNELEDQVDAGRALDVDGGLPTEDPQHATDSPETESPATESPATESPATESPATESLEIENPETESLEIESLETDGRETLLRLLESGPAALYDRVWTLYEGLNPESSEQLRHKVLLYLGRSSQPTDAQRVYELYQLFQPEEWTEDLVRTVLKALFLLEDSETALVVFQRAVELQGLTNLLDDMLAHCFEVSAWKTVRETMKIYAKLPADLRSTAKLPQLAAMPDFVLKFRSCRQSQIAAKEDAPRNANGLALLLKLVANTSLVLFEAHDALAILRGARDALAYEAFIRLCVEEGNPHLASDSYKLYRQLPGVRINLDILRLMADDVYYRSDPVGMQMVHRDWYVHQGSLDARAYHKFIAFYAAHRDLRAVSRLAAEYRRDFPSVAKQDESLLASEMNVYATRGNPEGARRKLEAAMLDVTREYPITTIHWNIYLNAFVKAGDFDGAIKAFSQLCDETTPDGTSFGTLMLMAGGRGDLQFTLELFQLANEKGVPTDTGLIDSVIEAYCQNDRFAEAEMLCLKMTRRKRHRDMVCTVLWNTLLHHHAMRRDLVKVNRLLETMSQHKVPYDNQTYTHLLTALLYCKQAHHAFHFIRIVRSQGIFRPTFEHYIQLMAAFLHTKEPHLALKVNKMMRQMEFPKSAARASMIIKAYTQWREMPSNHKAGKDAELFLDRAVRTFRVSVLENNGRIPDTNRALRSAYSKMFFMLTQMREMPAARWFVRLYDRLLPDQRSESDVIKMLHNVMLVDYYEEKFDAVKSTWDLVLQRTMRMSMPPPSLAGRNSDNSDPPQAAPRFRYSLSDPLKTMQRMYTVQEKPEALMALIADVTSKGFRLDSKNWNYYVQSLAQMKQWMEAFTIAEEKLMPTWDGWHRVRVKENRKNEIPLEVRRLSSNPKMVRPIAHTLIILTKAYLDLEQMALWSKSSSQLFTKINIKCPMTVRAITTMDRSDSEFEAEVFSGRRAEATLERDFGVLRRINKETTAIMDLAHFRPEPEDEVPEGEVPNGQLAADLLENDLRVLEKLSEEKATAATAIAFSDPESDKAGVPVVLEIRDKKTTTVKTMVGSNPDFGAEPIRDQWKPAVHDELEFDFGSLESKDKGITPDEFRAQLLEPEVEKKPTSGLPPLTGGVGEKKSNPSLLRHIRRIEVEVTARLKKKEERQKKRQKKKEDEASLTAQGGTGKESNRLEEALLDARSVEKSKDEGERVPW